MNTFISRQDCHPREDLFCAAYSQLLTVEVCRSGHSTIDTLADDVLLCIFDSYRRSFTRPQDFIIYDSWITWPWQKLVHVCRRWRHIFFTFPGYLNLRLVCRSKTQVQVALEIWPTLPLCIHAELNAKGADEDDIIGALEHRDRMGVIDVGGFNGSQLKKCIALMQEPFPVLRSLHLGVDEEMMLVIPDAFLGGSAPRLQGISLYGTIRFQGLPKLLSSTCDLVKLCLCCIPIAGEGHISPDVMTTCLSVLTKLQFLTITFPRQTASESPYPTDQRPRPSPSTHTVLPALTRLQLKGPYGYLEELLGRLDAPLLDNGNLKFYDNPIYATPRVPQFIHRAKMFKLLREVTVDFYSHCLYPTFHSSIHPAALSLLFPYSPLPAQVAIMEHICAQWPPLVSHVEFLWLDDDFKETKWREAITPWLGLLRPFTAVHTLWLYGIATVSHVARVLGELKGERATEVLPALRTVKLGCSEPCASESLRLFGPFVVARKESERPVVVTVDVGFKC